MRLTWTPDGGVRGQLQSDAPETIIHQVTLKGYRTGFQAELETDQEVIVLVRHRQQDQKRERQDREP